MSTGGPNSAYLASARVWRLSPVQLGENQAQRSRWPPQGWLLGSLKPSLRFQPAQRDVLLLCAWGELSQQEIAAALGLPAATVRSRLWRARGALRSQLLGPGFDLDPPAGCAGEGSPGLEAKHDLPRGDRGDEHGR